MKPFNFELKTKMSFGQGSALTLCQQLIEFGFKKPAFVVDKNIFYTQYVDKIFDTVEAMNPETILYEFPGEPTYDLLETEREKVVELRHGLEVPKYDCLIAIGGGSVIDFAKGLSLLATNNKPALYYRGFPKDVKQPIPVVAMPTTAGTGSEVTYNAVFINSPEKKKLGINTKLNYPVLAILDPVLVLSCPPMVMLSSALDALTHAVESYGATKSNEMTRLLSRRALLHFRYSLSELRDLEKHQEETKIRIVSDLQLGAYYAGIALMNSGSGPAGALSYVLGTNFNVPHGLAGGVFLPHIIDFNVDGGYRYTDFSDEEINFNSIFSTINFDFNNLRQFGVTHENVGTLFSAIDSLQPAFDQNPVPFTIEDAKRIVKGLL